MKVGDVLWLCDSHYPESPEFKSATVWAILPGPIGGAVVAHEGGQFAVLDPHELRALARAVVPGNTAVAVAV